MRIAFNIALLVSVLFLPWWLFAIVLVAAFFVVGRFFEGVLWGLVADVLYGSYWGFYGWTHAFLVGSVIVFAVASVVRDRLAWQR
ncbi:MAG: hypothetical protein Q8L64_05080 [bacterium]|nr:hypothetical protein [bacterium]